MDAELLREITLLERSLHGIILQRERLGVTNKELEHNESDIKKQLADKKQKLRELMEQGGPPKKPRQPALIKNGLLSLEMMQPIIEIEDRLCAALPVMEVSALENDIIFECSGPAVMHGAPEDGMVNFIHRPGIVAAGSVSTYPLVCVGSTERVCSRKEIKKKKNDNFNSIFLLSYSLWIKARGPNV